MNNNKKFIVATLAGIALCCATLAAPGPRGGRPGGPGGRGAPPAHHVQHHAPRPMQHAHRPPPPPPRHHHHHSRGLGIAAGIVNLVHDLVTPAPVVVQRPTTVVQAPPVVYQTPTVYQPTTTTVYHTW